MMTSSTQVKYIAFCFALGLICAWIVDLFTGVKDYEMCVGLLVSTTAAGWLSLPKEAQNVISHALDSRVRSSRPYRWLSSR